MRNLFKLTMGILVFTGAGWAMAEEGMVADKPLVKTQINADANVESNTKVTSGRVDVNESSSAEIRSSAIRENIRGVHADLDRDARKFSEDVKALKEAEAKADAQATEKAKADVEAVKALVKKDRERLKKFITEQIEEDRAVIRKVDHRIHETRRDIARDSKKLKEHTDKLAEAQSKNASDDMEKAKADMETDKTAVDADKAKLEDRIAYKAKCVLDLKNDRRHLDEVIKHLASNDEVSVSDTTGMEASASAN